MIKHHWIGIKVHLDHLIIELLKQAKYQYELDNLPECTLSDYEYDELKKFAKDWFDYQDPVGSKGLFDCKRWEPKYIRQAFEYVKELSRLLVKYYPMDFDDGYNPCKTLPWR